MSALKSLYPRKPAANAYLGRMFKAFEFCIPTKVIHVPASPDWLHEVKYDGYRLRLEREGNRVRLITRGGYNWTDRYPWIVEAARRNRVKQFVIDGEAVVLGVDGISDFDALHSRRHDAEVQLYAFDILALDGEDLRRLPLSMRKTNLAHLLARRPDGIFVAPFEQGEIGPELFHAACRMGLEGLVSKRRDRPYQAGRSKHWVKVKNRQHPAMERVMEARSDH
jgi:bifunctional non-homologous end joining protein LigD